MWGIVVTAANVSDVRGAELVFAALKGKVARLELVKADSAYQGERVQEAVAALNARLEITEKLADQKGFVVVSQRWVIERTLSWGGKFRRLSKDYEFLPNSSETMFRLAMISRMTRFLKPP